MAGNVQKHAFKSGSLSIPSNTYYWSEGSGGHNWREFNIANIGFTPQHVSFVAYGSGNVCAHYGTSSGNFVGLNNQTYYIPQSSNTGRWSMTSSLVRLASGDAYGTTGYSISGYY